MRSIFKNLGKKNGEKKEITKAKKIKKESFLLPDRHPNRDFFIADIFDGVPFKDDMSSMEHPIFSLSTKRDTRTLDYKNNGVEIKIRPSTVGLPTIFDKDILLYCGSLLIAEVNKGIIPPKTIRISTHDMLVATNRPTGGSSYARLKESLERLKGVSITTNIKTNEVKQSAGFGLIDKWSIIESCRIKKRMIKLEITVSDWFYNSLVGKEVLTINRDYFRIRQPLERRIYEIARKHCGEQEIFKINLEALHKKTGSASTLSKFNFNIRKIIVKNTLPDYLLSLERKNVVVFRRRKALEVLEPSLQPIKTETIERGKEMVIKSGTGWDFYYLEQEFKEFNKNRTDINNIDALFIGFLKKKIKNCP